MPIVDIEFVRPDTDLAKLPAAGTLAAAIGQVFGSPPGRTWVRMRTLDAACYAENESTLPEGELPVFATVLHAHPPVGAALAAEVRALTGAIAACCACPSERVHVQYAPAAAGRQAFGGSLVE